jgi:hypothetical protein
MSLSNGEVILQRPTGKQSPKCVSHFGIHHDISSGLGSSLELAKLVGSFVRIVQHDFDPEGSICIVVKPVSAPIVTRPRHHSIIQEFVVLCQV